MRTMTEINGEANLEEKVAIQAVQDAMENLRKVSGASCLLYAFRTEKEAEDAMKKFDAALRGNCTDD